MQIHFPKFLFGHSICSKPAYYALSLGIVASSPAFATTPLKVFIDAADNALNGMAELIKAGPVSSPNYREAVGDNVIAVQNAFHNVLATVPPDISEYPEFMEYCGRDKINYKTPPINTKIFINESDVSGISLSGIQHLYFVGKWNPTGFSLPSTLLTLGFFDGSGLIADQRTAISYLVKTRKKLQNLIVMNWGAPEIAASAFCGTGEGTNSGSLVNVIIHNATTIQRQAFKYCCNLRTALFPDAISIKGQMNANCAFSFCTSLSTVSFPAAETLEFDAFSHSPSISTAFFPVVKTINSWAFCDCSSLWLAMYPANALVASYAFLRCASTFQRVDPF
jgi:hypothetical protein